MELTAALEVMRERYPKTTNPEFDKFAEFIVQRNMSENQIRNFTDTILTSDDRENHREYLPSYKKYTAIFFRKRTAPISSGYYDRFQCISEYKNKTVAEIIHVCKRIRNAQDTRELNNREIEIIHTWEILSVEDFHSAKEGMTDNFQYLEDIKEAVVKSNNCMDVHFSRPYKSEAFINEQLRRKSLEKISESDVAV